VSCTATGLKRGAAFSRLAPAATGRLDITPLLPLVRSLVVKLWLRCRGMADLDDLLQEAACGVLRNLHKYDPAKSDLSTFVGCQAVWAAKDYLRGHAFSGARRVHGTVTGRLKFVGVERPDLDTRRDPWPPALPRCDCHALLSHATRRQRQCLCLYFLHGLTEAQAAARLGVTEGAVSVNIRAGLARIRRACREP
jgi:DNA-directed RNA polymerase specialized sigma24 family protein